MPDMQHDALRAAVSAAMGQQATQVKKIQNKFFNKKVIKKNVIKQILVKDHSKMMIFVCFLFFLFLNCFRMMTI